MQLKVPMPQFELDRFLMSLADFATKCHGPEALPIVMLTENDLEGFDEEGFEESPERNRAQQSCHLEQGFKSGTTLILEFAEPNVGEPVRCADGKSYEIDCGSDDANEYCGDELTRAVLLVRLDPKTAEVTIETGLMEGDGCELPSNFYEANIGSLEKPAHEFMNRFIR